MSYEKRMISRLAWVVCAVIAPIVFAPPALAKFNKQDHAQLINAGIPVPTAQNQVKLLMKGKSYVHIDRPCKVGDGIVSLTPSEMRHLQSVFRDAAAAGRVEKFQPASGAASRMFKVLHEARNSLPEVMRKKGPLNEAAHLFQKAGSRMFKAMYGEKAPLPSILSRGRLSDKATEFFENIDRYAFFKDLNTAVTMQTGQGVKGLIAQRKHRKVLELLLDQEGLNYGQLPKGSVLFHHDGKGGAASAFEEHIAEGLRLVADKNGKARFHFTVPVGMEEHVAQHIEMIKRKRRIRDEQIEVSYSTQGEDTAAVAIDSTTHELIREKDGSLSLRASGHGALLPNLDRREGDILMIKNIDNVLPENKLKTTVNYKEALGGLLVEKQAKAHKLVRRLKATKSANDVTEAVDLLSDELGAPYVRDATAGMGLSEAADYVTKLLDRPFRVCGMVENEGEPGGGPFFATDSDGRKIARIVESQQVDMSDRKQRDAWNASTHFSPVDFVLGVRDHANRPYDLTKFADPNEAFISDKTKDGKKLRAFETGLWHGAMSDWNTIFVAVPNETFNPAKEVFDLLRPRRTKLHALPDDS